VDTLPTSAVIQAGDPLAVSYSFEVAPSIQFLSQTMWARVGVDFPWVALSFAHEEFAQNMLSGRDGQFLEDRRLDTIELELRHNWGPVRSRAQAMFQRWDASRLAFIRSRFGQFVSFRPLYYLRLGLNAEESFSNFSRPRRRTDSYSGRLTLDAFPRPEYSVRGFAGIRILKNSDVPNQTITEAGIRAPITIGKLQILPTLSWTDRTYGPIDTADFRFEVSVIRRF